MTEQLVPDGELRCRFVWIVDVLPDELEPRLAAMMDRGIEAIGRALGPASGTSGTPAATAGG